MPGVMSMKTGSGRAALDDDGVDPGRLERGPPRPARVRGPDEPGEGRLEDHMAAAGRRSVRPDEGRGGDDDDVVRAERIALRIDGVIEQARGQSAAAEIVGDEGASRGLKRTSPRPRSISAYFPWNP